MLCSDQLLVEGRESPTKIGAALFLNLFALCPEKENVVELLLC